MIRWLRSWGPALLWAALIFTVSGRSSIPVGLPNGLDKAAHLCVYLVLGICLAWGFGDRPRGQAAAILMGLAYAATDEIHQVYVPGRSGDPFDWVADAVGVMLGVVLLNRFFPRTVAAGDASRQRQP